MRKGLALACGVLLVGAATCAAVVGFRGDGTGAATPTATPSLGTAAITRQDLVDTKTVEGALTYSGRHHLTAGALGTVTWVAAEGAVIRRGRPLLKIDRKPLVLMYGKLPLYRKMRLGVSDGPDVKQLERNLKALGYGAYLTVDDHFSYATYLALRRWQHDLGLSATGLVDASQVVFLPTVIRVVDAEVGVGDKVSPGRPALTVSGIRRLVHVDLDTDDQALARKGAGVTVKLPGGEHVPGKITSVGAVAKSSDSGQGQNSSTTTVDVDITLEKTPKTKLDQAPVEVEMESERHKNVLAVPVEALLALRDGGFGVEVAESGATRIVPVAIGAFGGGMVEITGDGLSEGMKVGVPVS